MLIKQIEYMSKKEFDALNERQQRILLGQYAIAYGYGGVKEMARRYGKNHCTVSAGAKAARAGETCHEGDRIRRKGAGRKASPKLMEGLEEEIRELARLDENGNRTVSYRKIAAAVSESRNAPVSRMTVFRILNPGKR